MNEVWREEVERVPFLLFFSEVGARALIPPFAFFFFGNISSGRRLISIRHI